MPPIENAASTAPAIDERASPAASSSSATNGNNPNSAKPSRNTARKQNLARGLARICSEAHRNLPQVDAAGPLVRGLPQVDHAVCERGDADRGTDQEHGAPAEQVGDHACEGAADHVAADHDRQPAGDDDLALLHGDQVADQRQADGKDAARRHAADDAGDEQHRVAGGERAGERGHGDDRQADHHQAHLADHVGDGPEDRLHQREGQRKGRRQQRHRPGFDGKALSDRRHDRIDGTRRQRRREPDHADMGEEARRGRRCAGGGHEAEVAGSGQNPLLRHA